MAEKVVCPKCGGLTSDARFCKHCGEPLHTCISCGAKISSDSRFCIECGIELKPADTDFKAGAKAYARYGPSMIPRGILIEGEEPLFETRPVLWLRLMPPIAFIIAGIAILVIAYFAFDHNDIGILYGCAVFFLLGALWALLAWLQWRHTIFAATNRRVLRQAGLIKRTYVDCFLRNVQTINLDVSLWGRINHLGTLRISGSGVNIEWESIDEPREAHKILNEIVEQYRRQPG